MDNNEILTPGKRFWKLIKPDSYEIRNVYIYAFFFGLVNLSLPLGIQSIVNLIQGGQINSSWVILVIFVIAGIAITGIIQVQQLKITEHLQQKIFSRAAFEFAYRIPKVKLEALYRKYAPELMNRFFDVVAIQKGLSKILIDFSTASIQTLFGLILLSLYHPFFIIYSMILVVMVWAIFKYTGERGLRTSLAESKNKYSLAHWLQELARTSTTFKLAGETDLPLRKTNKHVGDYIEKRESHFSVLLSHYSLMIVFKILVAAGLLIVGSILVMEQQMNIGQFVAAEIIILLIIGSVEKLIMSLETIYDVLTSLEKVGQVTDLELESERGIDPCALGNNEELSVDISEITFSYPGSEKRIFDKASLTIPKKDRVMITGAGQTGKTTLLYLLGGLYQIKEGSISYNDIPFGNLNPIKLRSVIGDCLMDEQLFEGTLLENISMGREKANFENVVWAVKQLGLDSFVKSLSEGYNTVIYPQGKKFPKGIVERLILARSIADKPKLLIISDTFSAIDSEEKERIFKFLTEDEAPWTLVVSTNDLSLSKFIKRQVVVENGKLSDIKV